MMDGTVVNFSLKNRLAFQARSIGGGDTAFFSLKVR